MSAQFTQQLLVGENLSTFLFTEKNVSETESIYIVCILNNDAIKPFKMYFITDHYEVMGDNVPAEIKDMRFQLNQAINNYNVMQSLLTSLNGTTSVDELSQFSKKNNL